MRKVKDKNKKYLVDNKHEWDNNRHEIANSIFFFLQGENMWHGIGKVVIFY